MPECLLRVSCNYLHFDTTHSVTLSQRGRYCWGVARTDPSIVNDEIRYTQSDVAEQHPRQRGEGGSTASYVQMWLKFQAITHLTNIFKVNQKSRCAASKNGINYRAHWCSQTDGVQPLTARRFWVQIPGLVCVRFSSPPTVQQRSGDRPI